MKFRAFAVIALPALLAASPDSGNAPSPVAISDFETGRGVDPSLGPAIAEVVRTNFGVMPPLYSVSVDQGANAKALVTGKISKEGSSLVLTVRVFETETHSAVIVTVDAKSSEPMAELVSRLTLGLGAVVLHHDASEGPKLWAAASLRGSDQGGGGPAFLSTHRTAFLRAVDGRPIPKDRENWSKDQPLSPGRHGVVAAYRDGSGGGSCLLFFIAQPGGRYEMRSQERPDDKVLLWVADMQSGQPVTVWATPDKSKSLKATIYVELDARSPQHAINLWNSGFTWVPGNTTSPLGR